MSVKIVNCVGGHGDVIFCEPIFRALWQEHGEKPSVIVHDHHMFFQDYIDSAVFFPASRFPEEANATHHGGDFINLKHAHQIYRDYPSHYHEDIENCMLDKYRLLGLPEELWLTCKLNFDAKRAVELHWQIRNGIFPYTLRNCNSGIGAIKIDTPITGPTIEMNEVPGFNIVDWFLIHCLAKEVHTVSTGTFYLMQAVKNWAPGWDKPVYLYPRDNWDGLRGISQLNPTFNLIRVC